MLQERLSWLSAAVDALVKYAWGGGWLWMRNNVVCSTRALNYGLFNEMVDLLKTLFCCLAAC